MKVEKEYDSCIESLDWRYSATIVGMIRYFEEFEDDIDYWYDEDFFIF